MYHNDYNYNCISGGLSVDWLSNKLYISRCDHLEVIDLINGYRKELNLSATCNFQLNSIVVDPTNRYTINTMCAIIIIVYTYHIIIIDQIQLLRIVAALEQVLNEIE